MQGCSTNLNLRWFSLTQIAHFVKLQARAGEVLFSKKMRFSCGTILVTFALIVFADLVKSEVETVSTVDEFEEKLVRSSFSDFVVI